MRLLNKEDFKGFNFKTNQSGIDILADICGVALEVHEQEKRRRLKGKEILIQHRSSSSPPSSLLKSYDQKENESKAVVVTAGDDQIVHGLKLRIPKPTTHKRSRNEEEDDGDDWDVVKVKNSKKSRKRQRRPSNFVRRPAPVAVPAELPAEFRREMEAMAGRDIKLGIQKEITATDLKWDHNRLSIPFGQIIDGGFLTESEKDTLRKQEAIEDVPLLIKEPDEQRMVVMNINLRQWDMAKQSGKTSSCYVLRTSWKDVAQTNRLEEHDVVQVWSFRVQGRLHLALVVVSRAIHQLPLMAINTGSTSTSGAGTSTGNNGSSSSSGSSGNNGSSGSSGNTQIVEANTPT